MTTVKQKCEKKWRIEKKYILLAKLGENWRYKCFVFVVNAHAQILTSLKKSPTHLAIIRTSIIGIPKLMFPVASIKITVRLIVIRTTPPARKARKEQKTVRQLITKHASWSVVNRGEAVFRKAQARKVLCMPYGKKMWYYCGYTLQMHFFYIGLVRDFDWLQSWQPCDLLHSVEYTRRKYSARSSDETFRRMLEDLSSGVLSGIIDDRAWTAARTTSYSTFTAECLTQMEYKRATEQERATRNDVNNHIGEHHLQTGRSIKSIGTLRHALRILQATINDSLAEAGSLT